MGNRREQRTRIALPARVVTRDAQNRPLTEMACSIDISPKGARLTGVRSVKAPGEVISVERGKSKAFFQVKWVGSREQGTEGQVGLFCIEPGSSIWGIDLLPGEDERYQKVSAGDDRRRARRFSCPGTVHIVADEKTGDTVYGELGNISEVGIYVRMGAPLPKDSKIRMNVKSPAKKAEFSVKGAVKMSDRNMGMWVEFSEITPENAPRLEGLLKQLAAENPQI